jgi:ribosomal protein S18 acetylase RimI-like enzyme
VTCPVDDHGWEIRSATTAEHERCAAIAEWLTESFTPSGVRALRRDLARHGAMVAAARDTILGFVVTERKTPANVEVLWLAVAADHQRRGVGSGLLAGVADQAAAAGGRILEVKTLDASASSPAYEVARRFYERRGFELLETIDPFPGWEPGNPCAIYVKALGAG